jgi:hypothetical protein
MVYIDDIIVAHSSSHVVEALLGDLKSKFALEDLGDLHFFLGIEVKKTLEGLLRSQETYASVMLGCYSVKM